MALLSKNPATAAADDTFEDLFLTHYDRVYGILYRLVGDRAEAEDLAQDVFLTLYRNPPRRRESNVSAWLYRVATNTGYNAVRGRRRRRQRDVALLPEPRRADDPAQQVAAAEERAAVRAALAELKPAQGQLLLLRQMGLSYAELAEVCDVAPGSVGQMLARAARAFRLAYIRVTQGKHHA